MKLPLWRLLAGFGVLLAMALMLSLVANVYADNLVLDRYIKTLAADPSSTVLSDNALSSRVADKAHQLGLPVQPAIVHVERTGSQPRIVVEKYNVQTRFVAIDLHFRQAASR